MPSRRFPRITGTIRHGSRLATCGARRPNVAAPFAPVALPLVVLLAAATGFAQNHADADTSGRPGTGSTQAASSGGSRVLSPSDMAMEAVSDSTDSLMTVGLTDASGKIPAMDPRRWRPSRTDLYEVPDREFTNTLWRMAGLPGRAEEGAYQVLLVNDSAQHAYLMRAGTQVGKLPDSTLPMLRQKVRSGALSRDGGGIWTNFWNPNDPLRPFLWRTGLEIEGDYKGTVMRRVTPQFDQHIGFTFGQRPIQWLHTEVGGHFTRQGGGLRRNLTDPLDQDTSRNIGGRFRPWWHAAVGVPGLKWEVSLSNRLFPEYYWLDYQGGEGSYRAGRTVIGEPVPPTDTTVTLDGVLMKEWRTGGDPSPSSTNVAHALHAKIGNIHYSAIFDRDVYRSVVHRVMFEELRAPFGRWGFGFVAADGVGHTLISVDLFPVRAGFGNPLQDNHFRFHFLRVDLAYRDLSTFHLGVTTSVMLDSRIFRPGDTR